MSAQELAYYEATGSVLEHLPQAVRASLTPEQVRAIEAMVAERPASRHPVDVRLTLPVPWRPMFLTILAGRERRSGARRWIERRNHPLHTAGNILFMLTSLAGIYALALFAALLAGTVIEF